MPSPGAPGDAPLASPNEGPLRVLVVDDDARVRQFLVEAFRATGCLVTAAPTAETALEWLAERPVDLVLADIRLPGLSGLDLLRAVNGAQPGIPVVLITGWPSVDSAVFGLRHGAYDYLRKPFSVQEVRQLLQRVWRDRQPATRPVHPPAAIAEDRDRQRIGLRGLFQVGELALQGPEPAVFVETVLDYTLQSLQAEAALILLRDDEGEVSQHQTGDGAVVTQLLSLVHTRFDDLIKTGGREALCLTGPDHSVAALAALMAERGRPRGILAVGRDAPHGAFLPDEHELLLRYAQTTALALQKAVARDHLESLLTDTVAFFITALESKDATLKGHSARVSLYTGELATSLGLTTDQGAVSRRAGLLHDLGKLVLLDSLLLKPSRLTLEEYARVRHYPVLGSRILSRLRFLAPEAAAVRHQLERYDGTGWPDGLRGDQIPLPARILTVADAFDAMTSPRPYRSPRSLDAAIGELLQSAEAQFDPAVVHAFTTIPRARVAEISRYTEARGVA